MRFCIDEKATRQVPNQAIMYLNRLEFRLLFSADISRNHSAYDLITHFCSFSRLFAAGALTPRWLPPQLRDHAFVKDTNLLSSPHSRTFSGQKSPSGRWEPYASRQYSENGHSLLSLSRIEFLESPASARSSAICLTYPFWPGHSPMVSKHLPCAHSDTHR